MRSLLAGLQRPPSLESVLSNAAVREFGIPPKHDIDLLFWLGGDITNRDLLDRAVHTRDLLRERFVNWHVTLLVDGPEWTGIASQFSCGREIHLDRAVSLPQALFGLGLGASKLPWAAFAWPGSNPDPRVLQELRGIADGADLAYAAGALPVPTGIEHPVQHGRLQMFDAIPMEFCLVATERAKALPFDCSPILQRLFWRDFVVRLSRHGRIVSRTCESPLSRARFWDSYPFSNAVAVDPDIAARYVSAGNDLNAFAKDLAESESSKVLAECAAWRQRARLQNPGGEAIRRRSSVRSPIRTLVLGGIYEPPNNELCFLRPFEKLRGQGYLTWRTKLYERCRAEDLRHYNLVIFGRPRYPECGPLMRECKSLGIGTIVMIDDNWIALGREKERYRHLFGPGQPQMETFLECVRSADLTIVYNRMLAEDLAPYAREIELLPPYIDLGLYAHHRIDRRDGLLVGYSGSERGDDPAFSALGEFARRHSDVELLFLGPPLPAALEALGSNRVHYAPYQFSYERHAKHIASLQPDILVAPLEDCRGWGSKVPNKYLEISTLGAAGIYSRVEPYLSYVREGETGLFAENVEQSWIDALQRLYSDRELRLKLAANAQQEVRARFSIEQAIPNLLRVIGRAAT